MTSSQKYQQINVNDDADKEEASFQETPPSEGVATAAAETNSDESNASTLICDQPHKNLKELDIKQTLNYSVMRKKSQQEQNTLSLKVQIVKGKTTLLEPANIWSPHAQFLQEQWTKWIGDCQT